MPLSAGDSLASYSIVAPLGEGGMGEVYRATDTRLKRQVAIKILPPDLASDPDRLGRFQREAEVLAALNNPHIAAIYGLEEAGGIKALVMELVEGHTLADRISHGPIPAEESIAIAMQIAEALEAAHDRGIIHRDLKPANIKVRDDGVVKVLDFGLAKLAEKKHPDDSDSPARTRTMGMTGINAVLGTAAYMSPEQARGRAVDKRTDVWAFGVVLFEMLSGVHAFHGEDATDMIASVVKSDPDWSKLPAETPHHLVQLLQRCLEKDRNVRIPDMSVARFLLTEQNTQAHAPASKVRSNAAKESKRPILWIAAALISGVLIGWLITRVNIAKPSALHLEMSLRPADQFVGSNESVRPAHTALALSSDGRSVVFAASRDSTTQLFVRDLTRDSATPIPGTEGALAPFFAPDDAWIGFWADHKLRRVPAGGGPAATICEIPVGLGGNRNFYGATWSEGGSEGGSDGGDIYFASYSGIYKVKSGGGTPENILKPDVSKGERLLTPHLLPGAKALLFTSVTPGSWDGANIVYLSLQSKEKHVVVKDAADGRLAGGQLVYLNSGVLMAAPFNASSGQLTGPAAAVLENVMQSVNMPNPRADLGAGQYALSKSGTLIYASGGINPTLESSWAWVDRTGNSQVVDAMPEGAYLFPRLSPNGQKIAVTVKGSPPDIWVYDITRGAPTRLTFDGGSRSVWSPNGKRLAYGNRDTDVNGLYVMDAGGSGKPEKIVSGGDPMGPSSWTLEGNAIAYLQRTPSGSNVIWVISLNGDRKPRSFIESRFALMFPEFSPDGHWMAYVSTESGGSEIYVQPYPGPGEKVRVSTAGGSEPAWSPDGRELLFRGGARGEQFYSAQVRSLAPFNADVPKLLFESKPGEFDSTGPMRSWSLSLDGRKFLMLRRAASKDKPVDSLHVILHWTAELNSRPAAK